MELSVCNGYSAFLFVEILHFIKAVYSLSELGFGALLASLGCYRSSMFSIAAFISGHFYTKSSQHSGMSYSGHSENLT